MINYPTYCPICGCEIYAKDKIPNAYSVFGSDGKLLPPYTLEVISRYSVTHPLDHHIETMPCTIFHCTHIDDDGSCCDSIFPMNDKDCK
ncbi:hypothetical protein PMX22_00855 [Clostridium butyricum]|uniref:hypothetical protein n=1 Tax=Clostridium butyricum TaxID=1492 RepID=UPI00232A8644|nr:hypothetical protein [Clostridium butyricum]MDB2158331.1 hypothetical protein [Clostridium butyricum]